MRLKKHAFRLCFLYTALLCSLFFVLASFSFSAKASIPTDADEVESAATLSGENFLLLGIDDTSHSADVIMLAHIDKNGEKIKLLQIPRDSLVYGKSKINSLYAKAYTAALSEQKDERAARKCGVDAVSEALTALLGVRVDHHAVLSLKDFRMLVDTVGGVPITLPQDLNYEDPAQGLSIHLKAGKQVLDGKAAEGLVRCRNAYPNADYGRMDAQRLFLSAFFQKLRYHTPLFSLFSLIRKAHHVITTDLSLGGCLSLGKTLSGASSENLLGGTLVGHSLKVNGSLCEVLPEDNLKAASLFLEGDFSQENAQKTAVGNNQNALALYRKPAKVPFRVRAAKETQ